MIVEEITRLSRDVSRTPQTVALSDVEVTEDGVVLPGGRTYEFDDVTLEKLSKFLAVPARYLARCEPGLQRTNLNYWLNKVGGGEGSFYTTQSHIVSIADPNAKSLPLSTYLDVVGSNFLPTDEVSTFISDPEYLHLDVLTEQQIEVPGDGTERRPRVGDITRAGIRIVAYPDVAKPPVVSSYLERLVCTNGLAIPEVASKINLRGKTVDEITQEFQAVVAGLKIDLGTRLEQYRETASTPIVGSRAQFVYNIAQERHLPQAVTARVMDLSAYLGDECSIYDVLNVFTEVANESVSYPSRMALQGIGGDFVAHVDKMLARCETCERPFPDFERV